MGGVGYLAGCMIVVFAVRRRGVFYVHETAFGCVLQIGREV